MAYLTRALIALIAGDIFAHLAVFSGEEVHGEQAVIRASLAVCGF